MALPRIRLPNIPADVVPYAITPDAHTARAGFGFGGRSSMDRQDEYRDMLIQRGYNPSDAKELAWLEERQAWADRAEENRPPETRTRAQLARQNFSPTEIDRLVGRPTNVDANLAAASAPLTIEPVAGEPRLHRTHAARMQALIASGMNPDQAMQVAGRQVVEAETAAGQARADARVQSGYRDPRQTAYNAETFADGYGFDESGNPAFLGRVDIDNLSEGELVDRGRRAYNARDPRGAEAAAAGGQIYGDYVPSDEVAQPLGMTAPGPRTLDGRPTAMPKPLMTPEDVEAYDVRPNRGLSQRDRDMAKRGMVPVVTADGVSYMLAYQPTEAPTDEDIVSGGRGAVVAGRDGKLFRPLNDGYQIPGGPGRAGPRPDLEDNYEAKEMVGPDGNPVMVLRPTPKFAGEQKEVMKTRRAALDADFQSRRAHRLALAKLAGGSQNINSGNRWMAEALLAMKPEDRASSMRYMLPGGNLAAGVDAQNMQNASEAIKRYLTAGAAGMMNTPATAMAVQQQKIAQRKEMIDWAEKNINARYASDMGVFSSEFSAVERGQAIQDLMDQYGEPDGTLTLADATRIVDNIGSRKKQPGPPLPMDGAPPGGYAEGPTTSL